MDTNNPMEGMAAEARSRFEDARKLFEQAWSICQDDYDACMAAHFLARHQNTPQAVFGCGKGRDRKGTPSHGVE